MSHLFTYRQANVRFSKRGMYLHGATTKRQNRPEVIFDGRLPPDPERRARTLVRRDFRISECIVPPLREFLTNFSLSFAKLASFVPSAFTHCCQYKREREKRRTEGAYFLRLPWEGRRRGESPIHREKVEDICCIPHPSRQKKRAKKEIEEVCRVRILL